MELSVFDIFKVGIGPSSSHTFGPMKAGYFFIEYLDKNDKLKFVENIKLELFGSLALTKEGHGTGLAIKLGLEGYLPENLNPKEVKNIIKNIADTEQINLFQKQKIKFIENENFVLHKDEELPRHPNGLIFSAYDEENNLLYKQDYYSIGGGFVELGGDNSLNKNSSDKIKLKYNFSSWSELEEICKISNKEVWEIVYENELCFRDETRINEKIQLIYDIMMEGINNSINSESDEIEGGLNLKRRTKNVYDKIKNFSKTEYLNEWLMLWAIASAEENASYGRVITAPTNGACGVIPAILKYYTECYDLTFEKLKKFIFAAGVIGMLCKTNASISGAEGGCQAEIGTACAMAAGGLASILGGNCLQCENAAIMALTHNLGLVCDPVHGLVQVPCIERNGINAVKAVSSARFALLEEEENNYLTLDDVIKTMKDVGDDMPSQYRETALGGLAKYAKTCNRKNCKDCRMCS